MVNRYIKCYENDVLAIILNNILRDPYHDFAEKSESFNIYNGGSSDEYVSNLGSIDYSLMKEIKFKMENNPDDPLLTTAMNNVMESFYLNLLLYVFFDASENKSKYSKDVVVDSNDLYQRKFSYEDDSSTNTSNKISPEDDSSTKPPQVKRQNSKTDNDSSQYNSYQIGEEMISPLISPGFHLIPLGPTKDESKYNLKRRLSTDVSHNSSPENTTKKYESIDDITRLHSILDEILKKNEDNNEEITEEDNKYITKIICILTEYYIEQSNCEDVDIFYNIYNIYKLIFLKNEISYIYLLTVASNYIDLMLRDFKESFLGNSKVITNRFPHDSISDSDSDDDKSIHKLIKDVRKGTQLNNPIFISPEEESAYKHAIKYIQTTQDVENADVQQIIVSVNAKISYRIEKIKKTRRKFIKYIKQFSNVYKYDANKWIDIWKFFMEKFSFRYLVSDNNYEIDWGSVIQKYQLSKKTREGAKGAEETMGVNGGGKNKLQNYITHIRHILGLNNKNTQFGGAKITSDIMNKFANMLRCFAFSCIGFNNIIQYIDSDKNPIMTIKIDNGIEISSDDSGKTIRVDEYRKPESYKKTFDTEMINNYQYFKWFDFEKYSLSENLSKNNSAVENDSFYYLIELLKNDKVRPFVDDLSQISVFNLPVENNKQIQKYKIDNTNSINKIKFPIYKYSVLNNDLFRMLSKTFAGVGIENGKKDKMKFIINNESAATMKYGLDFDPNGDDRPLDNILPNYVSFIDSGPSGSNSADIIYEYGDYKMGFQAFRGDVVKQQYTLDLIPSTGIHTITISTTPSLNVIDGNSKYTTTYTYKKHFSNFRDKNNNRLTSWNKCSADVVLSNSFNALQNYFKNTKKSNTWDFLFDDLGQIGYSTQKTGNLKPKELSSCITDYVYSNIQFPEITDDLQNSTVVKNMHPNANDRKYPVSDTGTEKKVKLHLDNGTVVDCYVYFIRFPAFYIFYQYALFKGLGDISQEMSTLTKFGGIVSDIHKSTESVNLSNKFNGSITAPIDKNNDDLYLPYDGNGNAPRCLISHDKASGSRFALEMIASLKFLHKNPDTPNQNNINMMSFGGYTGKLIDSLFVKPTIGMINVGLAPDTYPPVQTVSPYNEILEQITDNTAHQLIQHYDTIVYQGGKIKKKTNNKRKKNKTHKRIKNKRNKKTNKRRNKTNKK
jgi:hypothetical protein